MPSLFRFLAVVGNPGRTCLRRHYRAGGAGASADARDQRDDPAGSLLQATLTKTRYPAAAWPARQTTPNDTLIELFLDMLAAERGARENTLQAYRDDLADFGAGLLQAGIGIARGLERQHSRLSRNAFGARLSVILGRPQAVRHPSALSVPVRGRPPQGRSRRDPRRTATRARLAENALDKRRGSPADGLGRRDAGRDTFRRPSVCARRVCIACSNCSTRPDCGCRSSWHCRHRRRGAASAC